MQSPNKTGQSLLSRGGGYDFTLRLRVLHLGLLIYTATGTSICRSQLVGETLGLRIQNYRLANKFAPTRFCVFADTLIL